MCGSCVMDDRWRCTTDTTLHSDVEPTSWTQRWFNVTPNLFLNTVSHVLQIKQRFFLLFTFHQGLLFWWSRLPKYSQKYCLHNYCHHTGLNVKIQCICNFETTLFWYNLQHKRYSNVWLVSTLIQRSVSLGMLHQLDGSVTPERTLL